MSYRVLLRLRPYFFLLPLGLLLLATWLIYAPGLHGGFLFDDYVNLPTLGASGPITHWTTFWRYITSGNADPIGRPLALLTFLIDARDWPTTPFPFKRTNLLLHLANGALLTLLLRQLGHHIKGYSAECVRWNADTRIDMAALLGASIWLLHPLLVSTTLYIVQREAILPATFTLVGLLLWLCGRQGMQQGRIGPGLIGVAAGLGGCTVLATLSKANGILLPALALVIEYVLFRGVDDAVGPGYQPIVGSEADLNASQMPSRGIQRNAGVAYRRAMLLFAWLPTTVVAAYLLKQGWSGFTHGVPAIRPWTLGQRLLTEPRVLIDYLTLLWLPRPFTPGLFNDQIQASISLWSPIMTLPALCTVVGLIAASWRLRRRWPVWTTAVLFYFVGQALESTTVALELYFEHRNYLPAMLMFWPLALWLCDAYPFVRKSAEDAMHPSPRKIEIGRPARTGLAILVVLGLGVMTHAGAQLWGSSNDQALLWARLNPDSPRAQAYAAEVDMATGHPALAIDRLRPLLVKYPDQVQLALNLFGAECQMGHVDATTISAADVALRTTRDPGTLLTNWFERVIDQASAPPCPQLTYGMIDGLLHSALTNSHLAAIAGREQDIYYLKGRMALKQGDAEVALNDFNIALDLQVRIAAALEQAALLGSTGHPKLGLAHLDHYDAERSKETEPDFGMPHLHAWVLQRQQYWPQEMTYLRATLQRDAKRQTSGNP